MTHSKLVMWILFGTGQFLYTLKRAYFMVKGPNPVITSYKVFFQDYWSALIFRQGAGATIFWIVAFYPDLATRIASWVGLTVNLTLPLSPPVALLSGLASDFSLDWLSTKIPWIKNQLPQYPTQAIPPAVPDAPIGKELTPKEKP